MGTLLLSSRLWNRLTRQQIRIWNGRSEQLYSGQDYDQRSKVREPLRPGDDLSAESFMVPALAGLERLAVMKAAIILGELDPFKQPDIAVGATVEHF